jgi:ubiquinone/menaquinone biosynthesis C-methylase UbiE
MPIDFHAVTNRYAYATREAHPSWMQTVTSIVPPQGKRVVDVGCGGGTYAHAWRQLGAAEVTGVDFSEQMVQAATERFQTVPHLTLPGRCPRMKPLWNKTAGRSGGPPDRDP